MPQNYKETLNLPKTDFPMKANLGQHEPEILKKWESQNLYLERIERNKGRPLFTLHDGPPYANSPIHIGTALNKILKDIVVRYKNMSGYQSEYVPGWDCHGLPIELSAIKKLGSKKLTLSPLEIRKQCREHALKFIDVQREQFKRLGVLGEWDTPYLTMSFEYEAQIVRELATLSKNGLLHRGKKVIHWCASCETALAEAEIEYQDKTSPSIYVRFPLIKDSVEKLSKKYPLLKNKEVSLLIWTTTPWTLPANMAIALHPEFNYVALPLEKELIIVAEPLLNNVIKECKLGPLTPLVILKSSDLFFLKASHPFMDRESVILLGDHVTSDAGTGCVHTAPGHGQEDYFLGLKHKIDIYSPVDNRGRFTKEVPLFEGKQVFDTNDAIIDLLNNKGNLLSHGKVEHSYPHCWRCKKPVLFRATEQWFALMDSSPGLRSEALQWIEKVNWIPTWGKRRIQSMMENRPDWCLSRQRLWGVPIPALHCKKCKAVYADEKFMNKVADEFEKEGGDYWFKTPVEELAKGLGCPTCHGKEFEKEKDILDVWFDSGCSFAAVLEKRKNLNLPADLYLEGSDQHRGWFHTSLLISAGTRKIAPYQSVLTHGFVVDGEGKKMSKSLGNVVEPEKVINEHGADILRLWVASENYQNDVPCSPDLVKRCAEAYRKIRNTCKFIVGNLYDFDPKKDRIPTEALTELDKVALLKLHRYIEKTRDAYETYEYQTFFYALNNYCIIDLSSFYLDILKDRLYTFKSNGPVRRSAQTALFEILEVLIITMAPILCFTSEEVYQYLPGTTKEKSVHLLEWPEVNPSYLDEKLENRWNKLLELRQVVSKALEESRQKKEIGNALEARVILEVTPEWIKIIDETSTKLEDIFIVSQVSVQVSNALKATIQKAAGQKCPRCWVWSESVTTSQPICNKCTEALS